MNARSWLLLSLSFSLTAAQDLSATVYTTNEGDLHLASQLNGSIFLNHVNVVTRLQSLESENTLLKVQMTALTQLLDVTCQASFIGAHTPKLVAKSASCVNQFTHPAFDRIGFALATASPMEPLSDWSEPAIRFFVWQGRDFVLDESIASPILGFVVAMDTVTFHNGQYLAAVYSSGMGQMAALYLWNSTCHCYQPIINQPSPQATNTIFVLVQNDVFWFITAAGNSSHPASTTALRLSDNATFVFNVSGASDVSASMLDGEVQISVASSGQTGPNGTIQGASNTVLFQWNGTGFAPQGTLPSYRTLGLEHVTIEGNTYLLQLNSRQVDDSAGTAIELYRWQSSSRGYTLHQTFNAPAVKPASQFFSFQGNTYLALSTDQDAQLHRWNGLVFVPSQALGSHGKFAVDFAFAIFDGQALLATAREPDYQALMPHPVFQWTTCRFATVV